MVFLANATAETMTMAQEPPWNVTRLKRRQVLRAVYLAPAGLAMPGLWSACSESESATTPGSQATETPPASAGGVPTAGAIAPVPAPVAAPGTGPSMPPTAAPQPPAAPPPTAPPPTAPPTPAQDLDMGMEPQVDLDMVPWASGGTVNMQGGYPDPFDGGAAQDACPVYPSQTLGPCYASPVIARQDISGGTPGIPTTLSFLVVDSDGCTPIANAEVDIWHTGANGVYSAFARGICNPGRADVGELTYCRGKRSTDDSGRVDFHTVFPGWYGGRTIHIHFTVRVAGRQYLTSQLYFDDSLADELMQEPDYVGRGDRDTRNAQDGVLGTASLAPVLFASTKRADGGLHAWKVLAIQTA